MEVVATIIGTMSIAMSVAGILFLLVAEQNTPQFIKYLTVISIVPMIICFAIIAANAKEKAECKVKYEKVKVELYKRLE